MKKNLKLTVFIVCVFAALGELIGLCLAIIEAVAGLDDPSPLALILILGGLAPTIGLMAYFMGKSTNKPKARGIILPLALSTK